MPSSFPAAGLAYWMVPPPSMTTTASVRADERGEEALAGHVGQAGRPRGRVILVGCPDRRARPRHEGPCLRPGLVAAAALMEAGRRPRLPVPAEQGSDVPGGLPGGAAAAVPCPAAGRVPFMGCCTGTAAKGFTPASPFPSWLPPCAPPAPGRLGSWTGVAARAAAGAWRCPAAAQGDQWLATCLRADGCGMAPARATPAAGGAGLTGMPICGPLMATQELSSAWSGWPVGRGQMSRRAGGHESRPTGSSERPGGSARRASAR